MSARIIIDYTKLNLTRAIYNLNYKGTIATDFELPAYVKRNIELNEQFLARYGYATGTKYEDISVENKELIRDEVFNGWVNEIWCVIRSAIGFKVDKLGWERITLSQKENLRKAVAAQIELWRTNLPWEVSTTVSKVAGDYSIDISATDWLTGYDSLSAKTKTFIRATGLLTIAPSDIPDITEEEALSLSNSNRITALEDKGVNPIIPTSLITREEVVNAYLPKTTTILTIADLDERYEQLSPVGELVENQGDYYSNEQKDGGVFLKTLGVTNKLVETRSKDNLILSLINGDNTNVAELTLKTGGVYVTNDNAQESLVVTQLYLATNHYNKLETTNLLNNKIDVGASYSKVDADAKFSAANNFAINEDNKTKDAMRVENAREFYTKAQVDTRITSAVSGGQVDLSNYFTSREVTEDFVNKSVQDKQEMNADLALPHVELRETPTKNSNQAARMEDIPVGVKDILKEILDKFDAEKTIERRVTLTAGQIYIDYEANDAAIEFYFKGTIYNVDLALGVSEVFLEDNLYTYRVEVGVTNKIGFQRITKTTGALYEIRGGEADSIEQIVIYKHSLANLIEIIREVIK